MSRIARSNLCLCGGLIAFLAIAAQAATSTSDSIVSAVRRGNCDKAVKQITAELDKPDADAPALFIAGRLMDEGICFKQDSEKAAGLFQRSATLGDLNAQLDYAATIGLGEGHPQDYANAGELCHKAGVDPSGLLPYYSLGYACTVRAVAGRALRMSLPYGAFHWPTKPAVVEFNPMTSELRILSAPIPVREFGQTGSLISAKFDARQAIQDAWRDAIAQVQRPDDKSLSRDLVQMTIDMDKTIEVASSSAGSDYTQQRMFQELLDRKYSNQAAGSGASAH
jgi:hypothetical protein